MRVAPGVRLEDPFAPLVRDARSLVGDTEVHDPLHEVPVDPYGRAGGGVFHRVLDQVLDDLAEAGRVGQAMEARRSGRDHVMAAEQRLERLEDLADEGLHVDGLDGRRVLGHDPDRREDRVDQPVQPLDLLERRVVPRGAGRTTLDVARLPSVQLGLVGEQVGVGADDRQRCAQLVRDEGDQLAAGLVDGLERLDAGFGLRLLAALLDDAREQVGHRAELGHVRRAEDPRMLGLDIEHADRLVVPRQRHTQHRGHEPPLVDAADPQEPGIGLDVRDDERLLAGGDRPRHAFPERDPRATDLETVEAVGRCEGQVRSIAVEEIERGDIGMEGVPCPVDDGLQQLVPRSRGRREAGDVVDEAQVIELVAHAELGGGRGRGSFPSRPVAHGRSSLSHVHHLTRVGTVVPQDGCGPVVARLRYRQARAG